VFQRLSAGEKRILEIRSGGRKAELLLMEVREKNEGKEGGWF